MLIRLIFSVFFNISCGAVKKVLLKNRMGPGVENGFSVSISSLAGGNFWDWAGFRVKMGKFSLDFFGGIGYNNGMIANVMSFLLRIGVVIAFWAFTWRIIEPRTQCRRIVRALLLTLGLLGILTVLRTVGGWYLGQCVFSAILRLADDFYQFFRFNSKYEPFLSKKMCVFGANTLFLAPERWQGRRYLRALGWKWVC